MTSCLRHAAKSNLKALCVVRDMSEEKGRTCSSHIKTCLAEVRYNRQCLTSHFGSYDPWHAVEIAITPNSLGVLMRKT